MGKLLILGMWPFAAVTTLATTIFLFFVFPTGQVKSTHTTQALVAQTRYRLFTALPSSQNTVAQDVTIDDARVEIVRQFLAQHNSPLEPYAALLVDTAQNYNLDFRLLPAIAMQESLLCRYLPADSHNCWGYGIYGDKVLRFDSYEEAIEAVAKGISNNYVYDGLTTPELIMNRYTPSSNGSWANAVRLFMEKME